MFRPLFVLVVLFVVIHAVLLGYSAMWHSPTPVEASTVVAGVRYWQAGQYDLYLVNPPLVPVVATLPIVLAKPETDWRQHDGHTHRPEFALGTDFIKINREARRDFSSSVAGPVSLWIWPVRWFASFGAPIVMDHRLVSLP